MSDPPPGYGVPPSAYGAHIVQAQPVMGYAVDPNIPPAFAPELGQTYDYSAKVPPPMNITQPMPAMPPPYQAPPQIIQVPASPYQQGPVAIYQTPGSPTMVIMAPPTSMTIIRSHEPQDFQCNTCGFVGRTNTR